MEKVECTGTTLERPQATVIDPAGPEKKVVDLRRARTLRSFVMFVRVHHVHHHHHLAVAGRVELRAQ